MANDTFTPEELLDAWPLLDDDDRRAGFSLLTPADAEELFNTFDPRDQGDLLALLPTAEQRMWLRSLAPDDAADLIQSRPGEERENLLALLDDRTRMEVTALLAYAEDEAGGLMNPRFARLRPEMSADEAISYLRRQSRDRVENIYYAYVLDAEQRLLGVISLRELVTATSDKRIRDIMRSDVVTVTEDMDQEAVSNVFAQHDLAMVPVVDAERRVKGVVMVDDIVDVVREEATEDIQKVGGMQALDAPYLQAGLFQIVRKRVGWLAILFVAGSLTATAMAYFDRHIEKAVVLALFLPLIISSGGNSGSQASTLIIRAMALDQVRLRDWLRVLRRELASGLLLGGLLGGLGIIRVVGWEWMHRGTTGQTLYTEHFLLVALTVAVSVTGIVLWGTITGAMLPFVLRRVGLDPASASAPFVATLVDVTGVVIYFSAASVILSGTLL